MTKQSTLDNSDFSVISLNVRGINYQIKRQLIFQSLKKEQCDIAFLQETYSSIDTITKWQDEWGVEGIFAHGGKHSRGVAILLRKGFIIYIEKKSRLQRKFCLV